MLGNIKITELGKAESYAYSHKTDYNAWITVIDEADRLKVLRINKLLKKKNILHFYQFFYDWSDEDQDPYIQKNIETDGPKMQHVNNIISFLEPLIQSDKIYNLGINCFAGVSRSTAVGIISQVMNGETPEQALQIVLKVRPQAWPNLRILRFASERLGIDILTPVRQWVEENKKDIWIG